MPRLCVTKTAVGLENTSNFSLIGEGDAPMSYFERGGGEGGRNPGVMGAEEEGREAGYRRGVGRRQKWQKFRDLGTIFRNRKSTQREPLQKGAGTKGAEGGKFRPPLSSPLLRQAF